MARESRGRDAQSANAARVSEWPSATLSPRSSTIAGADELRLIEVCGVADGGLERAAADLAARMVAQSSKLSSEELTHAVRRAGTPYVWPKAWSFEAPFGSRERMRERLETWAHSVTGNGERRCGAHIRDLGTGNELVVVLAARVLADLAPVPTWVRSGTWVDIDARLGVEHAGAKAVVLGPRGAPRNLPTTLHADRAHARFVADQRGLWLVQLMANVRGGPRPVLEAFVFAEVAPDDALADGGAEAPGERDGRAEGDPTQALARMLEAARRSEGRRSLRRDARLDVLAERHAHEMRDRRLVAHDVGSGDPAERLAEEGVLADDVGENVARARDAASAHRALWASPSHRANLLSDRYDSVGIGTASDDDGSMWVSQLFARSPDGDARIRDVMSVRTSKAEMVRVP